MRGHFLVGQYDPDDDAPAIYVLAGFNPFRSGRISSKPQAFQYEAQGQRVSYNGTQ